jgi:hypothetical protein
MQDWALLTSGSLYGRIYLDGIITSVGIVHGHISIDVGWRRRCSLFHGLWQWNHNSHLVVAVVGSLLALVLEVVFHVDILIAPDAVLDWLVAVAVGCFARHGGRRLEEGLWKGRCGGLMLRWASGKI